MTDTPTLTGQDIAEAQGAVRGLLDKVLAGSGATGNEWVTFRVLTGRGPWTSGDALRDYLASQPQLDLDTQSAGSLVNGLQARGLITSDASGDGSLVQLTEEGTALFASLGRSVAEITRKLYARIDPDELATAHQVLVQVIERAGQLCAEL